MFRSQPRVYVERLLQILVATLVVLGTMLLGMTQRTMGLSVLSAAAAAASIYLTDVTGRFKLNRLLANLMALGTVAFFLPDLIHPDIQGQNQSQLFTVAKLQALLQINLFFQQKNIRVYGQLALLSLGQVVVASALNLGLTFGLLLTVYMIVGVLVMLLLLFYRELSQVTDPVARLAQIDRRAAMPEDAPSPSGRLRWPLAGNSTVRLAGAAAPLSPGTLGVSLFRHTLLIGVGTLFVTLLMFFLVPRTGGYSWQTGAGQTLHVVGFSKSVDLDAVGEVAEDPDVVMRARFFKGSTREIYPLVGEPLFRGAVVTEYRDGKWLAEQHKIVRGSGKFPALPHPNPSPREYVRQEITIEPLDEQVLFCLYPIFGAATQGDAGRDRAVRWDIQSQQLVRFNAALDKRLDFTVGGWGFQDGRQPMLYPPLRGDAKVPLEPLPSEYLPELLQLPEPNADGIDPLAGLKAEVEQVLGESQLAADDRMGRAKRLERYLNLDGDFAYQLGGVDRNRQLDPLEDFVTEHRQGHCEYFAGALVLMLRSQGIPARMVLGFKGGEWNAAGSYYQVRQLHAHAWVEAFLEPRHFSPDDLGPGLEAPNGAWLVLDPTTSGLANETNGWLANLRMSMSHYVDFAQVLWRQYVVGLNSQRQQDSIYQPLMDRVAMLLDAETWSSPTHVALAGIVLLLTVVGLHRARRWLRSPARRRAKRSARLPASLEIYRRLEAVLARCGLERASGQTPYEFALDAGGVLAEQPAYQRLASLPRRVVEAFYRVRFGRQTLDNHDAEAVEQALAELERTVGKSRQ